MKGNCKHELTVFQQVVKVLTLCNDQDGNYYQDFETRHEVEEFIAEMREKAKELPE